MVTTVLEFTKLIEDEVIAISYLFAMNEAIQVKRMHEHTTVVLATGTYPVQLEKGMKVKIRARKYLESAGGPITGGQWNRLWLQSS
jgi:hypothetical protein